MGYSTAQHSTQPTAQPLTDAGFPSYSLIISREILSYWNVSTPSCLFNTIEAFKFHQIIKEGNSKGGENDGRLLIGFYYSAVTGNRKQVLTGSSESCEHKCRRNTLSFKLQVLFES